MTTKQIFDLAVQMGMKADLRGPARVKKYLEKAKAKYKKLTKEQKEGFDIEKLTNPYSDTRLLVDNGKKTISKILVGIDAQGPELLLAEKLGADLLMSHHPEGKAYADLHGVMDMQAHILADHGVPINIAEAIMKQRIIEVGRRLLPVNHNRSVDMAKLLKIDFMCVHTAADNLSAKFVKETIEKAKPDTIEDVLKILKSIPEYREAIKSNMRPALMVGHPDNSCGKVAVIEFAGGTSYAKEMYEKLSHAGIGTIVSMHMGEENRQEAEKYHINVVIADHMASDSLGMNLFLDEIEKKEIQIIPCSGLIRVKRFKK